MKKKLISFLLAAALVCSVMPSALAATDEATEAAQALYELGLFRGTGTNADGTPIFDLDKTPTRNQAIIMLVRLLGKEDEALSGTWDIPFTDVTEAMRPYIGYAYTNGLTNGYTATTYCGTNPIKANQYITFVLRALGYESGKDFEVGTSYLLSDELGITNGTYANTAVFTRGDVAEISCAALSTQLAGKAQTLKELLLAEGAIRAWHETDDSGRLFLKTSLYAHPANGCSLLFRLRFRDGSISYDWQYCTGGSVCYEYTSWLSFFKDGQPITQVELFVYDRMDAAQSFWTLQEQERLNEKQALERLSECLVAHFTLTDTVKFQRTDDCFTVTDLQIDRNEAAQQETYAAFISDQILSEGEYALIYQSENGVQNAAVTYLERAGDHLTFTREIDHFTSGAFSGVFYIAHCRFSKTGEGVFLCETSCSSGYPYQL